MVVQLGRDAAPLLRQVRGKPHASSEDHKEEAESNVTRGFLSDDEIYGDPLSSDDELVAPISSLPSVSSAKDEASEDKLRELQPKLSAASPRVTMAASKKERTKRKPRIRPPGKGTFERGRKEKAPLAETAEAEKENNAGSSQPQSSAKRRKGSDEDHIFSMGYEARKPTANQRGYGKRNIHASTGSLIQTNGSKGALSSVSGEWSAGSQPQKTKSLKGLTKYSTNKRAHEVEDDSSDVSDVSLQSLKKVQVMPKNANAPRRPRKPEDAELEKSVASVATDRPNLLASLGAYRKEDTPTSSLSAGISTPPSSLPRSDILRSLEQYANDTHVEKSGDKCPLCEKPVDPEHYLQFWRDKDKKSAIRYQQMFCREHAKRSAVQQYMNKGYCEIDWDMLPTRIAQHSGRLTSILRNERPSYFRQLHADMDRQTGSRMMEENATLTRTGYYGSRGTRVMMESITSELADVIRDQAVKDPVVGSAGVANFVLRVLVPELAILLVMEDYKCSEQRAKGIIDESGELGALVNEDLGDELEAWDSNADDGGQDEDDVGKGEEDVGQEEEGPNATC